MIKRLVYCDRCSELIGEEAADRAYTLAVLVERKMDMAGSSENDWKELALCYGCCRLAIRAHLKSLDYRRAADWYGQWSRPVGGRH